MLQTPPKIYASCVKSCFLAVSTQPLNRDFIIFRGKEFLVFLATETDPYQLVTDLPSSITVLWLFINDSQFVVL